MLPAPALSDHVTAVLTDPVTVAVNCTVCKASRLADPGATETLMVGSKLINAVAVLVGSATLVAVTVTSSGEGMDAGAV